LKVTDGTTTVLKSIPITAVPYKPELDLARIISIEASNNKAPDFPIIFRMGIWQPSGQLQVIINGFF